MSLVTFEAHHGRHGLPADRRWLASRYPGEAGAMELPLDKISRVKLLARAEAGRWIVDCPWCAGAELAGEDGLFFCCNCRNRELGHAYARTVFPPGREKIEAELARLPLDQRNWSPV